MLLFCERLKSIPLFHDNQVAGRLGEFRDLVKEVVRSACRTALLEAGFTPDDYYYDGMESPGLYTGIFFEPTSHLHFFKRLSIHSL